MFTIIKDTFLNRYNKYNLNQKVKLKEEVKEYSPPPERKEYISLIGNISDVTEEHEKREDSPTIEIISNDSDTSDHHRRRELLVLLPTLYRSGKTIIYE